MRQQTQNLESIYEQARSPVLAPGVGMADYVAALRAAVPTGGRFQSALNLFDRWSHRRFNSAGDFHLDEMLLGEFRKDLEEGRILTASRKKYRSMARIGPSQIYQIHNLAAGQSPLILRPLLDANVMRRVQRLERLTPATREAILWFSKRATRSPNRGRRTGQVMTAATRASAVQRTLRLLDLLDLALRRGELAGIRRDEVRPLPRGGFQVTVQPGVQKMSGKPRALLHTLYPQTEHLLRHYLATTPASGANGSLITDRRGGEAGGRAIAAAVRREAARLGLRCYHSDRLPSPHDLRRTFASVNVAPLGLQMDHHTLAQRMRASAEVVERHYIQQNPLLTTLRSDVYRQRLRVVETDPEDPREPPAPGMDSGDGNPPITSAPDLEPTTAAPTNPDPIEAARGSEEEGIAVLRTSWRTLPASRALREYLGSHGASRRRGVKGRLQVNLDHLRDLSARYVPLSDYISPNKMRSAAVRQILATERPVKIGRLWLVPMDAMLGIVRSLRPPRDTIVTRAESCKTESLFCAKQQVAPLESSHDNVA